MKVVCVVIIDESDGLHSFEREVDLPAWPLPRMNGTAYTGWMYLHGDVIQFDGYTFEATETREIYPDGTLILTQLGEYEDDDDLRNIHDQLRQAGFVETAKP